MSSMLRVVAVLLSISTVALAQRQQRFEVLASFAKTLPRVQADGRVFLGPQEAFYITWVLGNRGGDLVVVPSPAEVLAVSVTTTDGQPVPVTIAWEPAMWRAGPASQLPFDEPLGQTVLAEDEAVSVYAVVQRANGQLFDLAEYRLTLDITRIGPALRTTSGARWLGQTTGGGVVRVLFDPVDSLASTLEYHRLEAAFTMSHDLERALKHRLAAVVLPGAQLGDRMALGKAYAELGRHADAVRAYGPLLPELMANARAGGIIRDGRHLRLIARSYIALWATSTRQGDCSRPRG